ncbi:preprotein translocase subunit SecG [Salinicola peritrichatus]|uniref:preprotein translocase subunit SecG n=1 Tax=Salinicola peritrichatus TaxID=1267424 RepID=UPI000DA1E305|nr:preprotein translocase subunit SecG [Salinicola peritrichatus]
MQIAVLMIHVALAIALVVLVLLQQGKGAEAGAAFGGGSSQTVFGSRGSGGFLSKLTGGLAALFFVTSLALAYFAANAGSAPQSGIPDAQVIEQQHNSAPTLDDGDQSGNNAAPALEEGGDQESPNP